MLKIIKNPDEKKYKEVTESVKANGGYCPCAIHKTEATLCPCENFKKQEHEGPCECGRYLKVCDSV